MRLRYPLVERTVAETPKLNDPAFAASVRERVHKTLRDNRGEGEGEPGAPLFVFLKFSCC